MIVHRNRLQHTDELAVKFSRWKTTFPERQRRSCKNPVPIPASSRKIVQDTVYYKSYSPEHFSLERFRNKSCDLQCSRTMSLKMLLPRAHTACISGAVYIPAKMIHNDK